jgi:hypothetical protein
VGAGILAAGLCLASCTVNQTLDIAADGSGVLTTHAEVAPLLHDYLASLAEAGGVALKEGRVFEPDAVRKSFQSRPGVVVQRAAAPTPSSLDLELAFDSFSFALEHQPALSATGAATISDDGDATTLTLRFDRAAWSGISAFMPPLQNPILQQLGPQGTGPVTEADYLAMISFSIGDAAPGLLRTSFVTLTVRPDGEILSQSGGTKSASSVVFRIPVLRLLVLDRPLQYSVTYRLRQG